MLAVAGLSDRMAGRPEKRPSSSSVPKVLAVQRWNVCAQVGGDDRLSFSDFWPLGADDSTINVTVLP